MSNELQQVFSFDNKNSYEKCDLTYTVFKDVDFSKIGSISFYRSDFRGTKFQSCVLKNNNFDLADFIGTSFINVEINTVNWGNCEIKNAYFSKCQFYNNHYNDAACHNTIFEKCVFENEVFRMTIFDCQFINCQFINCTFDQCSADTLEFIDCNIIKTEMSTMHAENFKFSNCIIRDTYLGACFLGTYFFKNVDMNILAFKYRGEIVTVDDKYFYEFIGKLYEQKRYFEHLNLALLLQYRHDFSNRFIHCINEMLKENNANLRNYNLKNSLDMLLYYFNTDMISFHEVLKITTLLNEISIANVVPKDSLLVFSEYLSRINRCISDADFDINYTSSLPIESSCCMTLHLNDESFTNAKANVDSIFACANRNLDAPFEEPLWSFVEENKGSIVLTVTTSLILGLAVVKTVKMMYGLVCDIRVMSAKTKKEIELIEKSKSSTALLGITNRTNSPATDQKEVLELTKTLGKDYIISTILKFML